jgi:hypothetical protein
MGRALRGKRFASHVLLTGGGPVRVFSVWDSREQAEAVTAALGATLAQSMAGHLGPRRRLSRSSTTRAANRVPMNTARS